MSRRGSEYGRGMQWAIFLLFFVSWQVAGALDPLLGNRPEQWLWFLGGPNDPMALRARGGTTHPMYPRAQIAAWVFLALPFVVILLFHLFGRTSRSDGNGFGSADGVAGREADDIDLSHGLGFEDAHYVAVYHRRQVVASVLSFGVIGIGLALRVLTGRTDHGSVVFFGAIVALFASYQLTARCPRCGVSLARANRKRNRDGWVTSTGKPYWRLVQCPDCGVRLCKDR